MLHVQCFVRSSSLNERILRFILDKNEKVSPETLIMHDFMNEIAGSFYFFPFNA